MNLLRRIKNLWYLSGKPIHKIGFTEDGAPVTIDKFSVIQKPIGKAQIIRRKTPTEEFLKNDGS